MTCFARPNIVLNQLAAQPYVDVVHSTCHGSSLIHEFTENTLHSSVHERLDEFPQTAALLVSSATLQLRGWIPPAPPASATCYPSARPRHPVGSSIESCRCGGVPTAPSPGSTSGSPGSKLKSSRPPDARGVLSPTPETSDQRLGLHTSTCLATRRDSVCASSNPHRCLETRGASLRCTSPVQPDRSSSQAPSLPTRRCPSAPASEMCLAELL